MLATYARLFLNYHRNSTRTFGQEIKEYIALFHAYS